MSIFDFIKPKEVPEGSTAENIKAMQSALMTLEDVIAPSAISINPKNINISGKLMRIIFVVAYPRYLNDGWLEPILNLEREMDVSITIHPINTADTLKKFQKKVAEVQSQINN